MLRAILDRAFVALLYVLPHHFLSRIVLRLTRIRAAWFKDALIDAFAEHFSPDMEDAEQTDRNAYASFNSFFTRPLRQGARPLPESRSAIISPVDAALSQSGRIETGRILQAKGHHYDLDALLGGDSDRAQPFRDGWFATLYLAPRDYHRIHMPMDGRLTSMVYVPGRLYSVNEASAEHVPGLFARNERVVCTFEGDFPFAVVLVGALFVGSMETVWAGQVTPRRRQPAVWHYMSGVSLERGDELGRFNMGSTVILILPPDVSEPEGELEPGQRFRMGEAIARLTGRHGTDAD
jgi:phosphatidylserine decarboxylase